MMVQEDFFYSLGCCDINAANALYIVHFGPSNGLPNYCKQLGIAGSNSTGQSQLFYIIIHRALCLYQMR